MGEELGRTLPLLVLPPTLLPVLLPSVWDWVWAWVRVWGWEEWLRTPRAIKSCSMEPIAAAPGPTNPIPITCPCPSFGPYPCLTLSLSGWPSGEGDWFPELLPAISLSGWKVILAPLLLTLLLLGWGWTAIGVNGKVIVSPEPEMPWEYEVSEICWIVRSRSRSTRMVWVENWEEEVRIRVRAVRVKR